MVKIGTKIESPQTGETLIFRSTEASSNGELFQAELIVQPGDYVISPHVHQNQEEQFVVLEGRFAVYIGDTLVIADAGETVVCPKGVPHSQWNAGGGVLRILYEHRPGLEAAEIFFETFFGLSRDGKLTKTGDLTLLQGSCWRWATSSSRPRRRCGCSRFCSASCGRSRACSATGRATPNTRFRGTTTPERVNASPGPYTDPT